MLRWIVLAGLVPMSLAVSGQPATAAEGPQVALLYSNYDGFRHRNEYDGLMSELGWKLDKVENTQFGALARRLGDYDILLGHALWNYVNVMDLAQWKTELLDFMDQGGAVVLTDSSYAQQLGWLGGLGEGWEVGVTDCGSKATPMAWLDTSHPLFSAVYPIREMGSTWMHLTPGAGWRVLTRCADGAPTSLIRMHGKGFMLVTTRWCYPRELLRNLWATLQLSRATLDLTLPDLAGFGLGVNSAPLGATNTGAEPVALGVRLTVRSPRGLGTESRTQTTLAPGQSAQESLDLRLAERGTYHLQLTVTKDGQPVYAAPEVAVRVPDVVELQVLAPAYRGSVYLASPAPEARAQVKLYPDNGLAGLQVWSRVTQDGALLSEEPLREATAATYEVRHSLAGVKAGVARLEVGLFDPRTERHLGVASRDIPVIAAREPQVFVDEDLNTVVNGKLFFPIAIYHVAAAEFAQMKELGFNTVQAWGSNLEMTRENLDAARDTGLMVILEGAGSYLGSRPISELQPWLEATSDHPALLVRYSTDEPSGDERFRWCRDVYQAMVAGDAQHPVYLVSCSPGEFGRFQEVTDVLGIDPYPIPSPVSMVSDWMRTAQKNAQGRRPVWLIPQLHNWSAYGGHPENGRGPTAAEERNMVYQGLIWGTKAIFYYPWDDGCTGLKYDAPLREAVRAINAELAELGPKLLACRHEMTATGEGDQSGLVAAVYRGAEGTYVLAANLRSEPAEIAVPAPGIADGPAEALFEGRSATVAGGVIRDHFDALGVHAYLVR